MWNTVELSTKEKAVSVLETLIAKRQAEIDGGAEPFELQKKVDEFTSYKNAIGDVEEDFPSCKLFIAYAILQLRLDAGEMENEELYDEVNKTAKNIILLYNNENPTKQQFNSLISLAYMPRNMEASNPRA